PAVRDKSGRGASADGGSGVRAGAAVHTCSTPQPGYFAVDRPRQVDAVSHGCVDSSPTHDYTVRPPRRSASAPHTPFPGRLRPAQTAAAVLSHVSTALQPGHSRPFRHTSAQVHRAHGAMWAGPATTPGRP